MDPMGCRVLIHEPEKSRSSWGFHDVPVYCVGTALNHYCYFTVFPIKNRSVRHSQIVEFCHNFITVPVVTLEEKVVIAITKLKQELAATSSPSSSYQLTAIKQLQNLFSKHKVNKTSTNINVDEQDEFPHQHHNKVELAHPLIPKKKVIAFKEKLT